MAPERLTDEPVMRLSDAQLDELERLVTDAHVAGWSTLILGLLAEVRAGRERERAQHEREYRYVLPD